jgi:hypothetical protein
MNELVGGSNQRSGRIARTLIAIAAITVTISRVDQRHPRRFRLFFLAIRNF